MEELLSLVSPQVVTEFDSFTRIVQMQIQHEEVAAISKIIFNSHHLNISHTTHLKHIVGNNFELVVRKSCIIHRHNIAVKARQGVGLRSPNLK